MEKNISGGETWFYEMHIKQELSEWKKKTSPKRRDDIKGAQKLR